jgi:hypothetical protein
MVIIFRIQKSKGGDRRPQSLIYIFMVQAPGDSPQMFTFFQQKEGKVKRFRPRIRSPAVIFSVAIVAIAVVALVGITAQPAPALTDTNNYTTITARTVEQGDVTATTKRVEVGESLLAIPDGYKVSAIEGHSLMTTNHAAILIEDGQRAEVVQPPAIASIRDIDYTAQSSRQDVAGIKKVDCFTADQRGQDVVAIRTSYTDTVSLSSRSIRL